MVKTIGKEELKGKLDRSENFVLLDVRSLEACKMERIKGAKCIPLDELEVRIKKEGIDKGRETIVYCSSRECNASPMAAEKLTKLGFSKVEDYKAGLKDWKEAGYPVEGEGLAKGCDSC